MTFRRAKFEWRGLLTPAHGGLGMLNLMDIALEERRLVRKHCGSWSVIAGGYYPPLRKDIGFCVSGPLV